MRKRKLCMICLPVIVWLLMTGIWDMREFGKILHPWQEGSSLTVTGIVYRSEIKEDRQSIYLKNISIDSNSATSNPAVSAGKTIRLKAELNKVTELQIGNQVQVTGICQYFSRAENDGGFDAEQYYASKDIVMQLKKAKIQKRKGSVDWLGESCRILKRKAGVILRKSLSSEEAGVMESLLLGEKSGLDEEIKELYQKNGIIHVLAISGLHVSVIGMSLFHFLRKRRLGFVTASVLSGIWIWFYAEMTGFSVSSVRAMLMFFLFLGAQILGRTYDLVTAMTVAGVLMLLRDPGLAVQSGFLLSYAAVAGVAASQALPETHRLLSPLKVSILTWLMTLPVTAYFYYQVPMYGIILNLFVVPSMSLIMMSGIGGILAGALSTAAGTFILAPVHYLLQITFALCRFCGKLPGAVWITGKPALWEAGCYYLILILLFVFLLKKRKIDLIKSTFGIILGLGILCYRGARNWSITFLSVGQGDGICIQTEQGHVWMVDGGSTTKKNLAKYCLEPYLKYWGIREVDGWMISHFDQDHVSGLIEILESYEKGWNQKNRNGITVKRILIPDLIQEEDLERQIRDLAGKLQIPVLRCKKLDKIEQDGMQIEVCSPIARFPYENQNEGSMTVKVSYQDFSVLLTGDLEGEGEKQLLESGIEPVDVLKVAHHGSRNSSSEEILKAIGGKQAVISCGKGNRYGHPHQELLDRLKKSGYQIRRTDLEGMIRFTLKKGKEDSDA